MKIYQLMFPDGDGYPIVPEFTYSNLPSLELVNKSLNDIDVKPLNRIQYDNLISKLDGKAYVKFNIKASSANWFYGNEMALKAIDIIDNPPVEEQEASIIDFVKANLGKELDSPKGAKLVGYRKCEEDVLLASFNSDYLGWDKSFLNEGDVILYDNPEANKYLYINLKDVKFK